MERAADDVAVVPALGHNLDNAARMPERIEIDRRGGRRAELLAEIAAADADLPHNRLSVRDIAVRLDKPAAHDMPAPFLNKFTYLLKQRRLILLYPLVK